MPKTPVSKPPALKIKLFTLEPNVNLSREGGAGSVDVPGPRDTPGSGDAPDMEITIYIPGAIPSRRRLSFLRCEGGRIVTVRLGGVRLNPTRAQLRRLRFRLLFVRSGLLDFIRDLALEAAAREAGR